MLLKILFILTTLYVGCITAYPLLEKYDSNESRDLLDISRVIHLHLDQPTAILDIPVDKRLSRTADHVEHTLPLTEQSPAIIDIPDDKKTARTLDHVEYTLPLIEKTLPFNSNAAVVRKVRHIGFGGGFGGFGGVIGGVSATPIYTSSYPIISTIPVTSTITTLPVVSSVSTIQTIPSYGDYGSSYGGFGRGSSYGYNYKSFGFGGGFLG